MRCSHPPSAEDTLFSALPPQKRTQCPPRRFGSRCDRWSRSTRRALPAMETPCRRAGSPAQTSRAGSPSTPQSRDTGYSRCPSGPGARHGGSPYNGCAPHRRNAASADHLRGAFRGSVRNPHCDAAPSADTTYDRDRIPPRFSTASASGSRCRYDQQIDRREDRQRHDTLGMRSPSPRTSDRVHHGFP